ncbi:ABC transporter substrate-binding protein [Streptomyces sp. YIM 98790]|uniref:ABC transporter substrate-binding protein n=1 Tax=Streptomyces sp. YIM 98790 TaxID=2689077 RepID=UPI0014086484|nr:iron-siderophore ABC transporter substrate-binding protein [Streptomyces sp. YIM 98790]
MRARWLTRFGRTAGTVLVTAGLLATAACSSDDPDKDTDAGGDTPPASSEAPFPRTVTHAMGDTVLEEAPERIVALDMTFVDAVMALEGQVAGYTTVTAPDEELPAYFGEDVATYAAGAEPVGLLEEPDLEKILELQPDLILSAAVRHEEIYDQLVALDIPVIFTETTGATWKDNLRLVGEALGKEDLAEQKISAFEERATAIGDSVRASAGGNPSVSVVRFVDGPTRLYKEDTYIGVIINDLGFDKPADAQGTGFNADISEEETLKVDADHIFVTAYPDPEGLSEKSKETFTANPLWGQLTGEIHEVDDETWMIAVGLYGAHSVLDDIAEVFGVDPAAS